LTYTTEQLLLAWRDAAAAEWGRVVRDFDPGQTATPEIIHGYFAANGWERWNGSVYTENSQTKWCGQFAGAMGQRVGMFIDPGVPVVFPVALDPDVARFCFPSTGRLVSANKWAAAGVSQPEILRPMNAQLNGSLTIDKLRPGMTCTIGDGKPHGTHIVIVDQVRPDEGLVDTIEGNAHGELGDGSWGEGVVRRRGEHARPFEEFRRAILLDPIQHFDDLTRGDL